MKSDQKTWLVTGASGHLGNTVATALLARGERVRALVMPRDPLAPYLPAGAEVLFGDVCDIESLRTLFADAGAQTMVIHCAGIVSIGSVDENKMRAVNVEGTRNVLALSTEFGVGRLVFVSSVHALPVLPDGETMTEIDAFDPQAVIGGYARTKAEATNAVLEAARGGLNASVVHPSGLIGPGDYGCGHLTKLVLQVAGRRLPASVYGGFDFVDVRDVAAGIIACAELGRAGEGYILGGDYVGSDQLTTLIAREAGVPPPPVTVPMWLAKATAPLAEGLSRLAKTVPLYTRYSLYTLSCNALFSSAKAREELGYEARPLRETVADTIAWLREQGRLPAAAEAVKA